MGCVERAPFAGLQQGVVGVGCVERTPFAGCYKGLGVKGWDGLCREPHLLAAVKARGKGSVWRETHLLAAAKLQGKRVVWRERCTLHLDGGMLSVVFLTRVAFISGDRQGCHNFIKLFLVFKRMNVHTPSIHITAT